MNDFTPPRDPAALPAEGTEEQPPVPAVEEPGLVSEESEASTETIDPPVDAVVPATSDPDAAVVAAEPEAIEAIETPELPGSGEPPASVVENAEATAPEESHAGIAESAEATAPEESHGAATAEELAVRAAANVAALSEEIEKLGAKQGRAFWEHVKNVNGLFRSLRPLPAEDRARLWDDFSAKCEVARAERAAWNEKADENARTVENAIESLIMGHIDADGLRYGEFWAHTKEVRELFKTTAPLRREDRRKLWERFKAACSATRKQQNDATADRRARSHAEREAVEGLLADARAKMGDAADQDSFAAARALLNQAMDHMRGAGKPADQRMMRHDARACWEIYKATSNELRERTDRIWSANYEALHAKAEAAVANLELDSPMEIQARVKEVQLAMRGITMDKPRRERLRRMLSDAWLTASRRIQEERDDRRRRRDDWIHRMEERVVAWEALLTKNEGIIESLESQIEDLERQIDEAWNETWAERAKGWLADKRQKVEDIRATNADVSEKLEAVRRKLPSRRPGDATGAGRPAVASGDNEAVEAPEADD